METNIYLVFKGVLFIRGNDAEDSVVVLLFAVRHDRVVPLPLSLVIVLHVQVARPRVWILPRAHTQTLHVCSRLTPPLSYWISYSVGVVACL